MLRVSQHPRHNSICFRPFATVSHPNTRAARRCGPRLPSLPVRLLLPRPPALRGCIRPPFAAAGMCVGQFSFLAVNLRNGWRGEEDDLQLDLLPTAFGRICCDR